MPSIRAWTSWRVEAVRCVVVFTDGDDTASKKGLGDVLDRARLQEMMIYAIGLESDYFNGSPARAHSARPRVEEARRRDGRRLLRARRKRMS